MDPFLTRRPAPDIADDQAEKMVFNMTREWRLYLDPEGEVLVQPAWDGKPDKERWLPFFSVETDADAQALLAANCERRDKRSSGGLVLQGGAGSGYFVHDFGGDLEAIQKAAKLFLAAYTRILLVRTDKAVRKPKKEAPDA